MDFGHASDADRRQRRARQRERFTNNSGANSMQDASTATEAST
jgi:hypothetical protein